MKANTNDTNKIIGQNKQLLLSWPPKYCLFGVNVSATTYDEALRMVIHAAKQKKSVCVSHLAVHGLITATQDQSLRAMLDEFEIVAPDGQPVRFALNILYKEKLPESVCGSKFTLRVCERAAVDNIGIYLYGSYQHVVEALRDKLITRYPGLRIVGIEPSAFRPLTEAEDDALVHRINKSGASVVFFGLGCPLQEKFAYKHKTKIKAVQICVGAAFDFLSGEKRKAPEWMQRHALEWFFRLSQEPGRLWRRYFVTNTIFLLKFFLQLVGIEKHLRKKQE